MEISQRSAQDLLAEIASLPSISIPGSDPPLFIVPATWAPPEFGSSHEYVAI